MKRIIYVLLSIIICQNYFSQLNGILTVPSSSYASLAALITALNQQGVSGSLIINVNSGFTETAPVGGYSLTASGTSNTPITFQKSGTGSNPLIMAYSGGSGTPGSMNQDGIWRLIGSDFITIDGIDLLDTNSANPATMEFGFALFKADAGNGCWNNTIKNCNITLNRINNASGAGPAGDGSRGIDVVNAATNAQNSAITVSLSGGSHSYNKFYGNTIQNCNQAIVLNGYQDISPFSLSDHGNEIGGNLQSTGNFLLNYGGGGTNTACAAIRSSAQYDLLVQNNFISNNTGSGINHAATLRGIYLTGASGANASVSHNTISLHGGGTNNQLSHIENSSGSSALSNTISIQYNLIINGTYTSAVSPSYYGIWNSASPSVLSISHNSLVNNSSHASGGSTYLIYSNGAVSDSISITNNQMGFVYSGSNPYTGTMYSIHNTNGTSATRLNISQNNFSNYYHLNATGIGNLYFISNANDSYSVTFSNNSFINLNLNHSGSEYLIYNSSATQSLLTVSNNSIIGTYQRNAATGAMYGYYGNGNSPAVSIHSISANNFSNISSTVSGSGVFYGIYETDGSSSPYPRKIIYNNLISTISMNSTGNFYGYYLDNMGESSAIPSEIFSNTISAISRNGHVYGMYLGSSASPSNAVKTFGNQILNLSTSGNSSVIYSAYLACGGAGLYFYKNKIAEATASGTAGIAHGIYITGATSHTLSNNIVGNMTAPNSSASNAVNGIYINSGSSVQSFYNTIYLSALSTGGNFNSNALYASSTVLLNLRNSVLINISSGGTGVAAAFRRSSTSLSTYSSSSNNNLFYAGTPSASNVILQNGSTAYQSLSTMQTALSPRDNSSQTQTLSFSSLNVFSPNYLHISANIPSSTESNAVNISGITDDTDSQLRQGNTGYSGSGTNPDIGADEFEQNLNPCNSANAGTLSVLSLSICAGQTISLLSSGYTPGVGLTHQWKVSNLSGGTYSNVSSGTGGTSPEFFSGNLNAGTYYFILETTCTSASLSAVSQEAIVVVNAIPIATASAISNLICSGQNLQLIGNSSIAGTYSWLGPNGFYSSVLNPTLINCSANAAGNYTLQVTANNCVSSPVLFSVSVSQVTLSVSANPPVLCSGNSSTLSLLTSGNTYTWTNGANTTSIVVNPSITTVYSVAVTNTAYCIASKQMTVSLISPSISVNGSVVCGNSGTVSLSANAFTPSTVNWYTSMTSSLSINAGNTCSLNVISDTTLYAEAIHTLSGCASLRIPVSVTLSAYPTLSVSTTPSIVCPGKSLILNASGANTYSWVGIGAGANRTVSPNTNTTYTVIGKNTFSCVSTKTVFVSMLPSPTLTSVQSANSVCPSSVLGFTASGAISYTWNTGANGSITTVTPATNSTYTVYGSNLEGCVSSKTLAVITRSVPLITIRQSGDSLCPGQIITFTASGANTYTWLPAGIISNTFLANPFVSSVFNAIGKSVNTCTQVAFALVTVDPCVSVEEKKLSQSYCSVYPNPASERLYIKFTSEGIKKISLYNSHFMLMSEFSSVGLLEQINLENYSKGIYFLKIQSDQNLVIFKVLKE